MHVFVYMNMHKKQKFVSKRKIYLYTFIELCNINFVYYNLSYTILWMAAFILSEKREAAELAKRVGIQGYLMIF